MQLEFGLPTTVGLFLLSATIIIGAAIFLATSCDVIADKSGWGRLWVGTVLLAGATSLPELVTNVSAVIIDAPGLAAGNIFGANMLNVSNLAIVIALAGSRRVFQQIMPQQAFLLGLAMVMTGLATVFAVIQLSTKWAFISPASIILLGVYVVGSRYMFRFSTQAQQADPPPEAEAVGETSDHSLAWGVTVFLICASAIFVAAPLLASSADRFAELTGISQSFIGVLAVAIVTTLPELTSTITAVKIRAYDLAISGMYGSNAFNVAALAVADLFSRKVSLFGRLDASHVAAGSLAVLLMGIGLVQLLQRKPVAHFALGRPSTSLIVSLYLLGLFVVFRLG